MTFSEFSLVLREIEQTTLRNQMMEKLAALFAKSSAEEIAPVVYLSLGCLRPKFDRLEFNLAEKMVIRAIARAYDTKPDEVTALYKEKGDLGIVAEQLRSAKSVVRSPEISIIEVYERLEEIAREEGQGSQERKVDGVATLLQQVDALSARYITRMVVGKLRLGVSDKTILDALSFMESGNKQGRDQLDFAYQVSPDIGQIARLVKEHGVAKVATEVKVTFGVPVVPALAQRLKTAAEMIDKMGAVALEPKYDGTRVQIHFSRSRESGAGSQKDKGQLFAEEKKQDFEVRTFTRNLDENSLMFPELQRIAGQIQADEVILDSEAVGFNPTTGAMLPFQMTITRKRKHGIGQATQDVPLKFFVFDILYKNGESLIEKPFRERREILTNTIRKGKVLEVDTYKETNDPQTIRDYHQQQLDAGLEGAMVKQIDGEYSPGRTGFNWVKFKEAEESSGKLNDTVDVVVMGYYRGKGKRTVFGMGAFLAGVLDEHGTVVTLAKIGTGLTDEQWREMKERCLQFEVAEKPKNFGRVEKIIMPDVWVNPSI
ncbi:hypothetical protein A3B57_00820, partial [Microgenomates group bacterium RIFCSPLOWO2_01_FULL_47_10]